MQCVVPSASCRLNCGIRRCRLFDRQRQHQARHRRDGGFGIGEVMHAGDAGGAFQPDHRLAELQAEGDFRQCAVAVADGDQAEGRTRATSALRASPMPVASGIVTKAVGDRLASASGNRPMLMPPLGGDAAAGTASITPWRPPHTTVRPMFGERAADRLGRGQLRGTFGLARADDADRLADDGETP